MALSMSERYFTESDKLGRKKYADFLRNMIDNSEKYQRDKMQKSYVIAVDSSWGTGKGNRRGSCLPFALYIYYSHHIKEMKDII